LDKNVIESEKMILCENILNCLEYEEYGIGVRNESSLHRSIKKWYSNVGDRFEVKLGGSVIDIVRGELLIEIQTKNFNAISKKLNKLLNNYKIILVYPISVEKWITTTNDSGEVVRRRKSPQTGKLIDIFKELVSCPNIINEKNFTLEVLMTNQEELRCIDGKGSWRRKGISIIDRNLISVINSVKFQNKEDFLMFLPDDLGKEFTNKDLAHNLEVPVEKVMKATYCLKKMGLIREIGKRRNELIFTKCI
jgi:hypothetical protein